MSPKAQTKPSCPLPHLPGWRGGGAGGGGGMLGTMSQALTHNQGDWGPEVTCSHFPSLPKGSLTLPRAPSPPLWEVPCPNFSNPAQTVFLSI